MTESDRLAEKLQLADLEVTCDLQVVTAGPIGAATAYGCWDAPRGFQWIAMGGQSTSHTEALRIVSGSDECVHPAGWPSDSAALVGAIADSVHQHPFTQFDQIQQNAKDWKTNDGSGMYGNGY
jgi:hypothetical protein